MGIVDRSCRISVVYHIAVGSMDSNGHCLVPTAAYGDFLFVRQAARCSLKDGKTVIEANSSPNFFVSVESLGLLFVVGGAQNTKDASGLK